MTTKTPQLGPRRMAASVSPRRCPEVPPATVGDRRREDERGAQTHERDAPTREVVRGLIDGVGNAGSRERRGCAERFGVEKAVGDVHRCNSVAQAFLPVAGRCTHRPEGSRNSLPSTSTSPEDRRECLSHRRSKNTRPTPAPHRDVSTLTRKPRRTSPGEASPARRQTANPALARTGSG